MARFAFAISSAFAESWPFGPENGRVISNGATTHYFYHAARKRYAMSARMTLLAIIFLHLGS